MQKYFNLKMSELIKRNNIDDSKEDYKIYQFLNDFKAKKCVYCFQDDVKFLCQCKVCGYFFCNNIHRKSSHIIIHLKQCKHKKISLSPFELELQCEECRSKDIFSLYFKGKKYLCEECLGEENDFIKIIENKRINSEILMCPDIPPVANRIDSYSESLIAKINNKINELKKVSLPIVSLNYTKKKKYCLLYDTLIRNEKYEIEKENDKDESFDFELKFSFEDKSYLIAEIKKTNQEFQFYPRQLLIVSKSTNENKSFLGRVIAIDKISNKITIFFKDLDKLLNDGHYLIKEKDSTASFDRILDGLNNFKQKDSDLFLKDIQLLIIGKEIKEGKDELSNQNTYLYGKDIPKNLDIKELENVKLNESQKQAINNCFKNKLTLIKGPPGTGKSTVLAILAYHLVKLRKSKNDKILICAPSNRAVDNISFILQKIKKLKFVRVLSMEREITEDVDTTNSLNDLIEQEIEKEIEKNQRNRKSKEIFEKRKKYGFLKGEDNDYYKKIIGEYQNKILNPCDIILSTINNSADARINNYHFPIVIIDEATQALEPDCIMPLYHKAQMVIIIGDEKQLGPTLKSPNSNITGISVSLFERLIYYYEGSSFISILKEQYRMHKFLYEFSNKFFYNNQMITNCEIKLDENVINNFPWPKKDIPTFFYHYLDPENKENNSYYNDKEIYMIYGIIHKLTKAGVNIENIGVITPYNAQKYRLYDKFDDEKYENLRIESVDGFQGMEKEYIIISTVRSNVSGNIGFLTSTKRLNVALTRAKKGVIILGNAECLARKAGIWRDLIKFYYSKKLIVKGPLSKLENVTKEEIFIKEIESDDEEENDNISEKEEKHKKVKKEIFFDYFRGWDVNKDSKNNNNSDEDDEPAPHIDNNNINNIKKNKNKKSKNNKNRISNNSSEEEEDEEIEEKKNKKNNNKNIKNKDSKYKEEDLKDEYDDVKDKKGKNKKNKNINDNNKEDDKKRKNNKKKGKNQSSSSDEEKNDNKNKEKKKDKKQKK